METPAVETPDSPAPAETPDDYGWFKSLAPETQQAIRDGGVNWDKQINKSNQRLVETRKALEKQLTEKPEPPAPATQRAELSTLKAMLKQRVTSGEVNADYADALIRDYEQELGKPTMEDQIRPVVDKYLGEVLQMQSMDKAKDDLVLASKGVLDSDKAFALINGFTSIGMTTAEALEEAKKIFKAVETDTVKKEVKEIMAKPNTKIITPGTTASKGGDSQDDILARVKAMSIADAKAGI
jgi:translation initiation factor 2 beta subunit (eIF-2beta)/eIF-5